MDVTTIKRLADFVAKYAEEIAACLSGASVGTGVIDAPPEPRQSDPLPTFKADDRVLISAHMPMHASPICVAGKVVSTSETAVYVALDADRAGSTPLAMERCGRYWATPRFAGALHVTMELSS